MMSDNLPKIKIGMLVSYDYTYIQNSLPLLYPYADYICFAIDKDRKTWSGESFEIPDSFFQWVKDFDKDKKIHIYEDSFYVSTLTALECDTRERNLLSQFMGTGGWHFQIDSDEYFLDFKKFVEFVKTLDITKETQVYARWITMYKQNGNDFFLIPTNEHFPVVTNKPDYTMARLSKNSNNIYTEFDVLHQSWGRSDEEISQKLRNWGHNVDFDVESYYKFWQVVNKQTYKYIRSFHPLDSWLWPSLDYFEAGDIQELTQKVKMYLDAKRIEQARAEKISLKDFIPTALYKIKAKLLK